MYFVFHSLICVFVVWYVSGKEVTYWQFRHILQFLFSYFCLFLTLWKRKEEVICFF